MAGEMTPENVQAFDLFYRAGKAGHSEAQSLLCECFRSGRGVAKNTSEAIEWVKKSADSGFAPAYAQLGIIFYHGKFAEIPKDEDQAIFWLKKAVDSDASLAGPGICSVLCWIYVHRGDILESLKWHRKGVEAGDPDFIYSGYKLCVQERVFETDMPEAYVWFQLAAVEASIADARQRADVLTRMMPSAELAKATQLFADTHSKYRANV